MTEEHFGHPDFYDLLTEISLIHSDKNHDYAGGKEPFKNFRISESMGIPAWKGCLVRMSDKFSRVCNFANSEELLVKDESVEDTLKDLAVYALICIILYRERGKNDSKEEN